MSSLKQQTGIRFSPELVDKMAYIAQKNKRSFNGEMEFLVEGYVRDYERMHGKIFDTKKFTK